MIKFDNSFVSVSENLYSRQLPTLVSKPGLIRVNDALAEQLGISPSELKSPKGVAILSGNEPAPGSDPVATVYAGHQFGNWNPQLGDGRAILLGEVLDKEGTRFDIQLKGAGITPYSRGGDGRSPLGPVLREYIVSEAMHVLGVPTTRALAAVSTGERVLREGYFPGAILTRVASSHIRVGTFQFFTARDDLGSVKKLADHVIDRHFPKALLEENKYDALLNKVINRQARLIAKWQSLGFIHGVMNTDNMLICGETVDYGPCAFMDAYNPKKVFSSIDSMGRYAYDNQPGIAQWNLSWFAQALLPLLAQTEDQAVALAQQALDNYIKAYQVTFDQLMQSKIGLSSVSPEGDQLVNELLGLMVKQQSDFTLTFRALADTLQVNEQSVESIYTLPKTFNSWLQKWHKLLGSQQQKQVAQKLMYSVNPLFIPRNHLIEQAIVAASKDDNFKPFNSLVDLLAKPFSFQSEMLEYAKPPTAEQEVRQTFCGT